jgi:ATP-binding cassette, subfamily B (MDR/TAP), member 1
MLDIFDDPLDPNFLDNANLFSIWFVIMAFVFLISLGSQTFLGTLIGENLTKTLRSEMYAKMLRMDIMWFYMPENAPGRLSSRLSTEPSQVNGFISSVLAITIQSVSSLLIGIALAFWASWRVSVVTFISAPFVLISSYFSKSL